MFFSVQSHCLKLLKNIYLVFKIVLDIDIDLLSIIIFSTRSVRCNQIMLKCMWFSVQIFYFQLGFKDCFETMSLLFSSLKIKPHYLKKGTCFNLKTLRLQLDTVLHCFEINGHTYSAFSTICTIFSLVDQKF